MRHAMNKMSRISCSDAVERSGYYVAPIYCLGPRLPLSFALKFLFLAQSTRARHLVKRTRIDSSGVHLNSLRALARRKYAKETTILLVLDRKGAAGKEQREWSSGWSYTKTGMLLRFMVTQRLEEWESRDGCRFLKCRLVNPSGPRSQDCQHHVPIDRLPDPAWRSQPRQSAGVSLEGTAVSAAGLRRGVPGRTGAR